jgi:hypothetical protein
LAALLAAFAGSQSKSMRMGQPAGEGAIDDHSLANGQAQAKK